MSLQHDDESLDKRVAALLADPAYQGHPLRDALEQLWNHSREQVTRLERVAQISDRYQSANREHAQSLTQRFQRQVRQLEKMARISDRYQQMMHDLNVALKEASTHDPLTGLPNRRLLMERLKDEVERCNRLNLQLSLVMLDVDHFKQVNDSYGHDIGDEVLIATGTAMQSALREYDLCGRWGGEEFLILLPETPSSAAELVVERIAKSIRQVQVETDKGLVTITVSQGLTGLLPGEDFEATLKRADEAMLMAKRNGRDCHVVV